MNEAAWQLAERSASSMYGHVLVPANDEQTSIRQSRSSCSYTDPVAAPPDLSAALTLMSHTNWPGEIEY